MITIDQLLESVDLDFEPRFVTKDEINGVRIWDYKPNRNEYSWIIDRVSRAVDYPYLKLAEFENKPWQECIYEVPRKTTGNENEQKMLAELERKLNAIVDAAIDAINELKGANNE